MAGKKAELGRIEQEMGRPGFWNDQEAARRIVRTLKGLKEVVEPLTELSRTLGDLGELAEIAASEEDGSTLDQIRVELEAAAKKLASMELGAMLSGPNDHRDAFLSVHAGAGGTESCDWAQMLLRLYLRWAERRNLETELISQVDGEEAGIRSVTIRVAGSGAYGRLRSEMGVHRLVRISPFDAAKRRHTSFASVDLIPEFETEPQIEIQEKDLRIDTYRAGGPGGQHVNKTSSAVRMTHLPTGIVVQCQNDRSQHRNRAMAMKMLKARLLQLKERERNEELAATYGEKGEISWGNQIRSYVLQPYTMVKDHRTAHETGDVQKVLDGDIDDFIEAYLRYRIGKN